MWFGSCTSSIGTWMQNLAQPWVILQITNSPFMLGLDLFLGQIPIFLFSLIGGVVADRVERRNLLLMSQVVQMTCSLVLTVLFAFHWVHVWHIFILSFLAGTAQSFGGPAYSALVPTLVKKEDLPNAIALNSIQFNLARVIGPMLGGWALYYGGAAWCFGLNGLSFVAVIVTLLIVRTRFTPKKTGESILDSMKEGIGFVRRQAAMEGLIVLAFCMTLLAFPLLGFMPVFAKDVLHGTPKTLTILLSCSGGGSVCGALIVASMGRLKRQGRAALLMLVVLGGLITAFALSRFLFLSAALVFISGAALMGVFATITSLVQLITPDNMRGRVMSVYNVAFRGGMPFGSLLVGWLGRSFTTPAVLAWNGVLLALLGLYFLIVQRRVAAL